MYVRLMSHWQPEEELVLGVDGASQKACVAPEGTLIEQMRRWDVKQYLPDDLLVKVDRASMSAAWSPGHRCLIMRRRPRLRIARARLDSRRTRKWILRKVLDRYVPRELIDRPKAGFSIPLAEWLRGH